MIIEVKLKPKITIIKNALRIACGMGSVLASGSREWLRIVHSGSGKRDDKVKEYEKKWTGAFMALEVLICSRTIVGEGKPRDTENESVQLCRDFTECKSCGREDVSSTETAPTDATSEESRLGETKMCISSNRVADSTETKERTGQMAIQVY